MFAAYCCRTVGDLTPRRRHIGQSSYQYSLSVVAVQVVEIWQQLPNKWRMPTSPAPETNIKHISIMSKK
jgi:hypothetical protein